MVSSAAKVFSLTLPPHFPVAGRSLRDLVRYWVPRPLIGLHTPSPLLVALMGRIRDSHQRGSMHAYPLRRRFLLYLSTALGDEHTLCRSTKESPEVLEALDSGGTERASGSSSVATGSVPAKDETAKPSQKGARPRSRTVQLQVTD